MMDLLSTPSTIVRALDCSYGTSSAMDILSSLAVSDLPSDGVSNQSDYCDHVLRHLNDRVDFRTGFSGHSSLQSSQSHANQASDRPFPKMSTHTGLTVKRGGKA